MKVSKMESRKGEKLVPLIQAEPGDVVRFISTTYEEAISGKDEAQFFMVINKQPLTGGRTALVSLDGKTVIERDSDREVIIHEAEVLVSPAKQESA